MRRLAVLVLLATTAGCGPSPEKTVRENADLSMVEERYDPNKDRTYLSVELGKVFEEDGSHVELNAQRNYHGKGRGNPDGKINLYFFCRSEDALHYEASHDVALWADKKKMVLEPEYKGGKFRDFYTEHVNAYLAPEQLAELAKASVIEGAIGKNKFRLGSNQANNLRGLASCVADPQLIVRNRKAFSKTKTSPEAP